jgi:hypothetical protein
MEEEIIYLVEARKHKERKRKGRSPNISFRTSPLYDQMVSN